MLDLLWRHSLSYGASGTEEHYLRHSTQANDLVVKTTRFRRDHDLGPGATTDLARRLYPVPFERLKDEVVETVIRMPLPKLQRFGTGSGYVEDRFLYDYGWPDEVSIARIRRVDFDDGLYLRPGVGEWLVRLAGLLRPIVQQRWAAFVADRSSDLVEASFLDAFLFGASRISFAAIREPLLVSQDRECFYCRKDLSPQDTEIDHFIPWSRHPDDALDNLVAAHARCNNAKRDSLAAATHLEQWLHRFVVGSEAECSITEVASEARWQRWPHPPRCGTGCVFVASDRDAAVEIGP